MLFIDSDGLTLKHDIYILQKDIVMFHLQMVPLLYIFHIFHSNEH